LEGNGLPRSTLKAVEWFTKATENGDAAAPNTLGVMFQQGEGVPVDQKKAVEYFELASHRGNPRATCNLGWCYLHGVGVLQDPLKAEELYRRSAEHGYAVAELDLEEVQKAAAEYRESFGNLSLEAQLQQHPDGQQLLKMVEALNEAKQPTHPSVMRKNYRFDPRIVARMAQTSKTARSIFEAQVEMVSAFNKLDSLATDATFSTIDLEIVDHLAKILERQLEYIIYRSTKIEEQLRSCVHRVLNVQPKNKSAILAFIYLELGSNNYQWLEAYIKNNINVFPDCMALRLSLVSVYGFTTQWKKGLEELDKIYSINPTVHIMALYDRAVCSSRWKPKKRQSKHTKSF
jgi:tetratricopeptide (TPR) repeat protein